MPTWITKLAPQAIVLAVAVYWSWPSLKEAVSKPRARRMPRTRSRPRQRSSRPRRFRPRFRRPPNETRLNSPGVKHSAKRRRPGKTSAKKVVEPTAAEAKDSGLVLNATCIVGQQRLALINGHVYKEKEVDPRTGRRARELGRHRYSSAQGIVVVSRRAAATGLREWRRRNTRDAGRGQESAEAGEVTSMANTAELSTASQPLLIQLLLEKEILTPEQVEKPRRGAVQGPRPAGKPAGEEGAGPRPAYRRGLCRLPHGAAVRHRARTTWTRSLAGVLPEKLCREHMLVPVEIRDDTLDVAFATFEDMLMVDELQLLTGMNIRPMMAPLSVVEKALDTLYPGDPHEVHQPPRTTTPPRKRKKTRRSRTTGATGRRDPGPRRAAAARARRPRRSAW